MDLARHLTAFGARAVTSGDAAFLARLYASTRRDLLGDGSADPAFAAELVAMHQRMQAADYLRLFPQATYLLLHARDEPVGHMVVAYTTAGVHLVDIALLPHARCAGIGSAVLGVLQEWAALQRCALTLTVQQANPRARRLYLALGFQADSADPQRLLWRGDFV